MGLEQDQIWKQGDIYYKITEWGRLSIEYREFTDVSKRNEGDTVSISKKEFCKLIKGAELYKLKPSEKSKYKRR